MTENTERYLDPKEVEKKYQHFLLNAGDFVVAGSGVTWGKIAEVNASDPPLCLNTSMIRLKLIAEPLAYFITFTIYGTFLQGDARGWRSRTNGIQPPQPLLEQWHRDRLNHDIIQLNEAHRNAVAKEIGRLCEFRGWNLWTANPRTNHVHVVVSASGYSGEKVRDQLKANCTRILRECWPVFVDRAVWSVGGDWKCIDTDDDLESVILYAGEAQDRMDRK